MIRRWCLYVKLLCALFSVNGVATAAQVLELQSDKSEYDIAPHVSQYIYPSDDLTANRILSKGRASEQEEFKVTAPQIGYGSASRWYRIDIKNLSHLKDWYFVFNFAAIRELDLYFVREGIIRKVIQLGDQFEFGARLVQHRNFVVPVEFPTGEDWTVLTKVVTPYYIQFPAILIDHTTYLQREVSHGILHGAFFGFLLVMSLYCLSNFVSSREVSYLYLFCFSLSFGLFQAAFEGFGFQFLWPTNVWLQHKMVVFSSCMSLLWATLFVSGFLRLKCDHRFLYLIYSGFLGVASVLLGFSFFIDEDYLLQLLAGLALFSCLLNSGVGMFFWHKGRLEAFAFTLGWLSFLVGIVVLCVVSLGLMSVGFITEYVIEITAVFGLVLLVYALANSKRIELNKKNAQTDKIREQDKVALREKERGFELQKASNERLERSIQARTTELHKTLAELTLVNNRLEELNTHDNITGLRNANAYEERIQHEWERGIRDQRPLSLIVASIDGFDTIGDRYGAVAAEESLKAIVKIIRAVVTRPADLVSRIGPAEFGFVLPSTEAVGALHIAQALLEEVSKKPINLGICSIPTSLSIGVATAIPMDEENFMTFMERAEDTMLDAIELGGNQIYVRK